MSSEKYQANRNDDEQQDKASEAGKKTAKVAAKGAADYFTGGKGGAVVDKLADTKLGNEILDKAGKVVDKTPGLNKAAQKLNDSGALDAADQALSMVESGGAEGAAGGAGGGNMPGLGQSSKPAIGGDTSLPQGKSTSSSMGGMDLGGDLGNASADTNFDLGIDVFGLPFGKNMKIYILIFCIPFLFLVICFVTIFSATDDNGTDPKELHSEGTDSCISTNLQAADLCSLRNQGNYTEWINKFGPVAQQDYSRTGVFASITIAQAMIESGWACHHIQNNLFGIKCHGYPTCTSVTTQEEYGGSRVTIQDSFRTYPSVGESIEDHSKFLKENSIYTTAGVFSAANFEEQARALKRAGYATASNYAESLINQIKQYNLSRFDVTINTTNSNECGGTGASASGWSIRTTPPTPGDVAFTNKYQNRGQCVWYAQGRAIEITQELEKLGKIDSSQSSTIINKLLNTYGHGGDWYDNTRGVFKGSNNVKDIKPGSLISWKKPGGYGHVAVIEEVTDDTVIITEGYAKGGSSCPTNWGCVNFIHRKISLNDFYNSVGPHYTGAYNFSGYVYFLELE